MAKQTDTQIEGTFGNKIYYKWRGEFLVRSKGNTGKQAVIAKEQSAILGRASGLSARLRKELKPMLPGPANRRLMYKMNNALQQWLRKGNDRTTDQLQQVTELKQFSFTDQDFYVTMPVSRLQNGQLLLHVPAFDSPNPIHPLPFDGTIRLHIMAVCCDLNDKQQNQNFETKLHINYNGIALPKQDVLLPVYTKQETITVIAMSVNEMSAGIVATLYN